MAFDNRSLDDYVDVAERIAEFRAKYPDGSLQPANLTQPWEQAVVNGYDKAGKPFAATMIVYTAAAYRTPDDVRPGIGVAWEVFPGRTPYTLGSELMNAETSAWGRAIIAVLASDSKRGVASRQEVQNRRAEREDGLPVNADGSLSRSQTTDAEKNAAGVMTSEQQAEHSSLRKGTVNGRVEGTQRITATPDDDPFYNIPGASGGDDTPLEDRSGTSSATQIRNIAIRFGEQGRTKREDKLDWLSHRFGREIHSSKDLSWNEAAAVLRELRAKAKVSAP